MTSPTPLQVRDRPYLTGKTLELAGPKVYTNKEIVDYVYNVIKEESNAVNLPQPVGYGFAYAMQQIPGPWMTLDGFRRQSVDLVQPANDGLRRTGHEQVDE